MNLRLIDPLTADALRVPVLRPDAPPGASMAELGGADALTVGAFDGAALVGTCVVFPAACSFRLAELPWQLRAMATEPSRRGRGDGAAVLSFAISLIVERGGRLLWCEARKTAWGFYERMGFAGEGDVFTAALGLPHRYMWRDLP